MREEILNKKLRTLQTFIDQAKENSENGWLVNVEFQLCQILKCLHYVLIVIIKKNKKTDAHSGRSPPFKNRLP